MSVTDITSDFLSYMEDTKIFYNSNWNNSSFLKSANTSLAEISNLQDKVVELKKIVKSSSRFDRDKNNKMILNIKQSIKLKQQSIKRLTTYTPDMKGSYNMQQQFKDAILASLQMRLLKSTFQFKQIYLENSLKGKQPTSTENARKTKFGSQQQIPQGPQINLNKSHFLEQSNQELLQEVAVNEYKQIEKSINEIFDMYNQSLNAVRMQDLMIGSIQNNITDIDSNVIEGKRHVSDIHRRQSKNRGIILKMFVTLYTITFIYIVFLS